MANVEGDIETLSGAILAEARVETEDLRAQAKARADAVLRRAQEQADRERKAILDQAAQEAERVRSQATATAQLKARALELVHREQLLDRVFQGVAEKLGSVQQRKDYAEIATRLLREALGQLRAQKAELLADAATRAVLTKDILDAVSKDLGIELIAGKSIEHGTGVVVETTDGHLHFDNTLETRLARLQGPLRASVYRVLMGETE